MFIENQIIISTKRDRHGDTLTKKHLSDFLSQLPKKLPINNEHDLRKPPLAIANNFRLAQLDNNEWGIIANIEILDDIEFKQKNGFSIAYKPKTSDIRSDSTCLNCDIEINYNPLQFNISEIIQFESLANNNLIIKTSPIIQKSIDNPAILIMTFATTAFASGFFGKAGADIYDKIKKKLIELLNHSEHEIETKALLTRVPIENNALKLELILEIPIYSLKKDSKKHIDLESAKAIIMKLPDHKNIKRAVLIMQKDTWNQWKVVYYITKNNDVIRL